METTETEYTTHNIYQLLEKVDKVKVNWLVEDLIPHKNPTILYGEGGTYKSFIALNLAFAVQNGHKFADRATQQTKVLYMAIEGIDDVLPRSKAHIEEYGQPEYSPNFCGEMFEFGTNDYDKLCRKIKELDIGFLIIDTLSLSAGGDISTGKMPQLITKQLRVLCDELGVAVLLIAHPGKVKDRGIKGASEFYNNVPTVLLVDKQSIRVKKQRSGTTNGVLRFELVKKVINEDNDESFALVWEESKTNPRHENLLEIIDQHKEGINNQELFEEVIRFVERGKSRDSVRKQFDRDIKTLQKTLYIEELSGSETKKDMVWKRIKK